MTIKEKYDSFVKTSKHKPQYIVASIHWKDTDEDCDNMSFKLSCDEDADDDYTFYYTNGINGIISLTDKNGVEDFYILEDTVKFY